MKMCGEKMMGLIRNWVNKRKLKISMKFVDKDNKDIIESKEMKYYRERFINKQTEMIKIMYDMFSNEKMLNEEKAMVGMAMVTLIEKTGAELKPEIKNFIKNKTEIKDMDVEKPSYIG